MFGQRIQWSHVSILAKSFARNSVRGGSGLIYLLMFLIVSLGIASTIVDPLNTELEAIEARVGQKIDKQEMVNAIVKFARPAVAWWVGADESDGKKDKFVDYLIEDNPPLMSAFLLILLAFIPFTTCLGSFNQLSGDIGSKGLRYLLLRTERINIIVARFLGTLIFSAVIMLAVMLIVILFITFKFDPSQFGAVFVWGLRGWFAAMILSIPYVCLCTWMSAAIDSPFASLVLSLLLVGFPIAFLKISKSFAAKQADGGAWLDKLTPWGWKFDLLHHNVGITLLAVLMMFVFSAIVYLLAVRLFLKRDL